MWVGVGASLCVRVCCDVWCMPRARGAHPPHRRGPAPKTNAHARTPPPPTHTHTHQHAQYEAVALAAFYEHRLQEGAKAVFHLEAFVAKFMSAYKNWAVAAFA